MKKNSIRLLVFLPTVILMGILGGIYSLIFAGIASRSAIALAPQFSFELVGRHVCPEGSQLQYINDQNAPSEVSYSVNCIAQDKTVTLGMESRAISKVTGMYFLICFIPTYIPGIILLWKFTGPRVVRCLNDNSVTVGNKIVFAEDDESRTSNSSRSKPGFAK